MSNNILEIKLLSKIRDYSGVWEVSILINNKEYTYPISSEYKLNRFENLLKRKQPRRALRILTDAKIEGFNSFEKEKKDV